MDASINELLFFCLEFCFKSKSGEMAIVIFFFPFFLINLQTEQNMEMLRSDVLRRTDRKYCYAQKTAGKQQTADAR